MQPGSCEPLARARAAAAHASAWVLTGALVFLPCAQALAQEAAAPDCGARALAQLQARFAGVDDLAARFEQHSVSAGFPEAQRARGAVEFAKPARMRWRYEAPEPSLVVSDGSELWIVEPAAKQVQVMRVAPEMLSGTALQLLLDDGAALRKNFAVRALACADGRARLRLTPHADAHYEYLELLVELESGALLETLVADLLGGQTRVRFSEVRTNLAPPAARFHYTPAADERVTRLAPRAN